MKRCLYHCKWWKIAKKKNFDDVSSSSVEKGVEKMRQRNPTVAMQHFNRALQVEPENVEGLVARGAL